MAKQEKTGGLFRSLNFKYGFIFTIACLVVYLIAFASPYWLQTYVSVPYDFRNMGLWEICFSQYYFREDPYVTEYVGCYWSFDINLDFRREVFNPGFFIMVQVLSVVILLFLFISTIITCLIFLNCTAEHKWTYWILNIALCGLMAITAILLFVIVVTVGAKSGDRLWMPRADLVWLSWGYAFAVLASLLGFLSAFFFGKEAKAFWGVKPPETQLFGFPLFRQGDAGLDPPDSASVF